MGSAQGFKEMKKTDVFFESLSFTSLVTWGTGTHFDLSFFIYKMRNDVNTV